MGDQYDVVVLLAIDAATSLDESSLVAALGPLGTAFTETNIPGAGAARRFLMARLDDREEAEELARRIAQLDGVETAYVKPAGEPPG